MQIGHYKFDRVEFAGSLGDLGTLIPLTVTMIIITGLSVTSVFLAIGLFYITSGLYFKLPIPVQPLKVVAAIAIAYPDKITASIIVAASLIFGLILLLLAFTGIIDKLAGLFSKQIIRGIQLGLGLVLMVKGIEFISNKTIFINQPAIFDFQQINVIIGIIAVIIVLLLFSNQKYPAALVIVFAGFMIGVFFGALKDVNFVFGPAPVESYIPSLSDFLSALILLVIPQIPLTIGNAIIGTKDTCISLFAKSDHIRKVNNKALAVSMGIINIFCGIIGGIPVCHGAGGLAAHYRFGARTGGSNIMIGSIFLIIALVFGHIGILLLSSIPNAILGTLLIFAGLELAMLIRDVNNKKDLFVVLIVAGIGFATSNMGAAVITGIIIAAIIKWKNIRI